MKQIVSASMVILLASAATPALAGAAGNTAEIDEIIVTARKREEKLQDVPLTISVVNGDERLYSQKLACTECGTSVPQLEPRSFSFNSPYGACETCAGLGSRWAFDPAKVIVDFSKPLLDGGLGPGANSWVMQHELAEAARKHGFAAAFPRGNHNFSRQTGEQLSPLGILGAFFAPDGCPMRMSRHTIFLL